MNALRSHRWLSTIMLLVLVVLGVLQPVHTTIHRLANSSGAHHDTHVVNFSSIDVPTLHQHSGSGEMCGQCQLGLAEAVAILNQASDTTINSPFFTADYSAEVLTTTQHTRRIRGPPTFLYT